MSSIGGVSSGEFDIASPADRFFGVIVEDMKNSSEVFDTDSGDQLTFVMTGFLILRSFETIKITITVTPKEDKAEGSHVAWIFVYEKFSEDVDDPHFMLHLFINYLKQTDADLSL